MILIGKTLVSPDLVEQHFSCCHEKCRGVCCVYGDSGAPLEPGEKQILQEILPMIKPYMTKAGTEVVQKLGLYLIDNDGDLVTPLIDGKECAFAYYEQESARCAIEKAFLSGTIGFRKPLSCHLYPVRIKEYPQYEAVNFDKWECCKPAEINGKETGIFLYQFMKDALVRKYGLEWFRELELAAKEWRERKAIPDSDEVTY